MSNLFRKAPAFLLFFALLLAMMLAQLLLPGRQYSEAENKYLASLPSLSLRGVLSGSFFDRYDSYLSDQIPLRDSWIAAKSAAEALLLKTENNGVVYGSDGYLFPKFQSYDEALLAANVAAIRQFAGAFSGNTSVMVVPSSLAVLSEKLPAGVPFVDEQAAIAALQSELSGSCSVVDAYTTLRSHADEYIYYRTDHHWTTQGAWYAYAALCETLGLSPQSYSEKQAFACSDFLGTSYSRCKKLGAMADTLHYLPNESSITVGQNHYTSIYDFTKLATRDKYAMFLHGNAAESRIQSGGTGHTKENLLIIKDSFADSLIPFLTAHYENITCIDPRYYTGSFAELAAADFDGVVILFGFETLSGENSISALGQA